MNKGGIDHKIYYILIPLGALILAIICNIIYDKYHQIKLDIDTKEIINYLVSKDYETEDQYKETAIQEFQKRGYDDSELISVMLGDDYLLIVKYHAFNDLKTFLNIFHIDWVDEDGMISDENINKGLEEKTGHAVSRYIVKKNEYNEPVIEKFDRDENEFYLEKAQKEQEERDRTSTTEAVVIDE